MQKYHRKYNLVPSQPALTCSKLTIEAPRTRFETCSELTIKTPERRHWHRLGIFFINFKHISHLVLELLLLTLSR